MFKTVISIFGLGLFIAVLVNIRYAFASGNHVPESKSKTSLSIRERFSIGNAAQAGMLQSALVIGLPLVGLWLIIITFAKVHPLWAGLLTVLLAAMVFVALGSGFSIDPLIRSDRTAQNKLVLALSALLILSPVLGHVVLLEILQMRDMEPEPLVGLIGLIGGIFLAVGIRAALLWSKEEIEPSRGYLFTLPLPMHHILKQKLRALIYHASILTTIALIMTLLISLTMDLGSDPEGIDTNLSGQHIGLAAGMVLTALPAFALFVVTLKLYFRSAIVTVLLSTLYLPFILLCVFDLAIQSIDEFNTTVVFTKGPGLLWLVRQAALVVGLGAWLFWLYSRSAIHERGPVARFFGALLFVATFYETAFLLLFANYRDLLFIIFGI